MTGWYYADAGGMVMTDPTRKLWQALRDNLLQSGNDVGVPLSRQASLLRTQLKADLEVYYGRHVSGDRLRDTAEEEFLRSTVLAPSLIAGLAPNTRRWMWFRYLILRRDEPIMRSRALWEHVIAKGFETDDSTGPPHEP